MIDRDHDEYGSSYAGNLTRRLDPCQVFFCKSHFVLLTGPSTLDTHLLDQDLGCGFFLFHLANLRHTHATRKYCRARMFALAFTLPEREVTETQVYSDL